MVVLAWGLPIDHVLACADDSVATPGATGADAFGFLKKPDTHLKTEVARSERPDGANINSVKRVIIFESFPRVRSQHRITATIDEAKHVIVRNLLTKTNAARAENTALIIQCHSRPEHDIFRFLDFVLEKTRVARAEIDAELL